MKKRLTRKIAIELTIELWEWCAKTGNCKKGWPKWETIRNEYGRLFQAHCPFCEFDFDGCHDCPYFQKFGACWNGPFDDWRLVETQAERKVYAGKFLKQLKTL